MDRSHRYNIPIFYPVSQSSTRGLYPTLGFQIFEKESSNREQAFTSPRAHHLSLEQNSFSRVFDAGARGLVLPLHNITTRISISSSVPREVINIIKSTLSWSQVCAQCFERGFGWEMFYRQSINYNYVSHNW